MVSEPLVTRRMSLQGKSHEDCLKLVCAVCTNLHGVKATRGVSDAEEKIIQSFVFSLYQKSSSYFPQGLCNICHSQLLRLSLGKPHKLNLPSNYHCTLP